MSAMTDDAAGFEPDAGLVPSEAKIARREMVRQLLRSKTFIVGNVIVGFWVFWALTGSRLDAERSPRADRRDILAGPELDLLVRNRPVRARHLLARARRRNVDV